MITVIGEDVYYTDEEDEDVAWDDTCSRCHGSGYIGTDECYVCDGTGIGE